MYDHVVGGSCVTVSADCAGGQGVGTGVWTNVDIGDVGGGGRRESLGRRRMVRPWPAAAEVWR